MRLLNPINLKIPAAVSKRFQRKICEKVAAVAEIYEDVRCN